MISPRELFLTSWKDFTSRARTLVLINLIPTFTVLGIGFIFGLFAVGGIYGFLNSFSYSTLLTTLAIILLILAILVSIVITSWGQIALLISVSKKTDVKQSFVISRKYILNYWWLVFLEGLIITGSFIPFIIPGIMFAVFFIFSHLILVNENYKGLNVLIRSREYVRGHWFPIFGRLVLFGLVLFAVQIVESIIVNKGSRAVLNFITNLIITPYFTVYLYTLYKDIKKAKGELAIKLSTKTKALYLLSGIFGIILVIAAIMGLILVYSYFSFPASLDLPTV